MIRRSHLVPLRGRRNTVEIVIVLFEISNSMKLYPSVSHAYTTRIRPVIGFLGAEETR